MPSKRTKKKYYVVWQGRTPGVYHSWEECKEQIHGYPDARYKAYESLQEAKRAFAQGPPNHTQRRKSLPKPSEGGPILPSWSVDGACSGNPGVMEFRIVDTATGKEIYHFGPVKGGTNNIAEILAIIKALDILRRRGDTTTPIYSDSHTAIQWYQRKKINTKVDTASSPQLRQLLSAAQRWLERHHPPNPVLKWNTEAWGEIPADFGRK